MTPVDRVLDRDGLRLAFERYMRRVAEEQVADHLAAGGAPTLDIDLPGVSEAGLDRAARRSTAVLALDVMSAEDCRIGSAFTVIHAMGEASALDMAVGLLSSPAVRGREVEALERLRAGETVDAILATPRPQEPATAAPRGRLGRSRVDGSDGRHEAAVVSLGAARRARAGLQGGGHGH